jgi:hypothetical protein
VTLCALSLALALTSGWTQTVPAAATEVTVDGRIAEVFGRRFILETDRGRILIDPASAQHVLSIAPGDRISATGAIADRTMLPRRISRQDGAVVYELAVPTGAAGIHATLAAMQLTPIGQPLRKKHHTEIMARMTDGRTVYVSLDRLGRVDEIEDAAHDKRTVVPARALSRDDYHDIARRAGFEPLEEIEIKKHHVELLTRNRAGEFVELHIDRTGYIYKQAWVR